ncbi:hypothetical protein AAMO2058_000288900 [Amorphochlora amoebiformis]
MLMYYADDKSKHPKGSIDILNADLNDNEASNEYCGFKLTCSSRVFLLRATTRAEVANWAKFIRQRKKTLLESAVSITSETSNLNINRVVSIDWNQRESTGTQGTLEAELKKLMTTKKSVEQEKDPFENDWKDRCIELEKLLKKAKSKASMLEDQNSELRKALATQTLKNDVLEERINSLQTSLNASKHDSRVRTDESKD